MWNAEALEFCVNPLKVVVRGLLNDMDETINVFYATTTSEDGAGSHDAAVEWVLAMFLTIISALSWKWRMVGIASYILLGGVWQLLGETPVTDVVGESETDSMPNQVAAVLSAPTTIPRTIGKKFLAGIQEGNVTNGSLADDFIALLLSFLALWVSHFTAGNGIELIPSVVSEKPGHATGPLMGGRINTYVGTQRRRKPGVGA